VSSAAIGLTLSPPTSRLVSTAYEPGVNRPYCTHTPPSKRTGERTIACGFPHVTLLAFLFPPVSRSLRGPLVGTGRAVPAVDGCSDTTRQRADAYRAAHTHFGTRIRGTTRTMSGKIAHNRMMRKMGISRKDRIPSTLATGNFEVAQAMSTQRP